MGKFTSAFFFRLFVFFCLLCFSHSMPLVAGPIEDYQLWQKKVQQLYTDLVLLEAHAERLGLDTDELGDWKQWLEKKVLPQFTMGERIVVATVGGTNIGKSTIFNEIAGENASAVATTGAGTKHAVLLVPSDLKNRELISTLFEGFVVADLKRSSLALETKGNPHLFWKPSKNIPVQILAMDAPDIDSHLETNWELAEHIGKAADIVVALLTQEKHADKPVIEYFKRLRKAQKPLIIVINKVDIEDQQDDWPKWLDDFLVKTETPGTQNQAPLQVYVAPFKKKSEPMQFFAVGPDGKAHLRDPSVLSQPVSLREEISKLSASKVILQTRLGALSEALNPTTGAQALIGNIEAQSQRYEKMRLSMASEDKQNIEWPILPANILVAQVKRWWSEKHRSLWKKASYASLAGLRWVIHKAVAAPSSPGLETDFKLFEESERNAVLLLAQKNINRLHEIADLSRGKMREAINELLTEESVEKLNRDLKQAYKKLPPLETSLVSFMEEEFIRLEKEHPHWITAFEAIDTVGAIVRPTITLSAGIFSVFSATPYLGFRAIQTAFTETGTNLVVGGATGGAAETLVNGVTDPASKGTIVSFFNGVVTRHAITRMQWVQTWLKENHFKSLVTELDYGQGIPSLGEFERAKSCTQWLLEASEQALASSDSN